MPSFLTRLKKRLGSALSRDEKSRDTGGRFMSLALCTALEEEPRLVSILFPSLKMGIADIRDGFSSGLLTAEVEYTLRLPTGNRLADLVVLRNGKPIALLETKYEDHKSKSNDAQISDYLKFIQSQKDHEIAFTILSQHSLPRSTLTKLTRNSDQIAILRYRDIHKKLSAIQSNRATSLVSFLKETSMVYTEQLSASTLGLLLVSGLDLKNQNGLGKLKSKTRLSAIPELIDCQFRNIAVLTDRLKIDFPAVMEDMRTRVAFSFEPWFDKKSLSRHLETEENDGCFLPDKLRAGGGANFWAGGHLGNGVWIYWGVVFDLTLKHRLHPKGPTLKTYAFTSVHRQGRIGEGWKPLGGPIKGRLGSQDIKISEEQAYKAIKASIAIALKDALNNVDKLTGRARQRVELSLSKFS